MSAVKHVLANPNTEADNPMNQSELETLKYDIIAGVKHVKTPVRERRLVLVSLLIKAVVLLFYLGNIDNSLL